jgi:hypothetical protein
MAEAATGMSKQRARAAVINEDAASATKKKAPAVAIQPGQQQTLEETNEAVGEFVKKYA